MSVDYYVFLNSDNGSVTLTVHSLKVHFKNLKKNIPFEVNQLLSH